MPPKPKLLDSTAFSRTPSWRSITRGMSLTGHSQGATGVQESIYCLLMMENNFICASANVDDLDPGAEGMPIVLERQDDVQLNAVLSNSFGFGGTNATLAFKRVRD